MISAPHPPAVTSDRRQRRSAEIRERLFRSALELFGRKGFNETTVEDITNAADVGKGTFFNYFPSKDHILVAFGEMQLGKLQEAVTELGHSGQDVREFLYRLPVRMTAEPMRNPGTMRMLLQGFLSSATIREPMVELQQRVHAVHTRIMLIGQERGEVRKDMPAGDLALVFRQVVFGTLLVWSLFGDDSLQKRIETALRVLWTGLAAEGADGPAEPRGPQRQPSS